MVPGCRGGPGRCSPSHCRGGGGCLPGWNSLHCDCSLTGGAGPVCGRPAPTATFTGAGGLTVQCDTQPDLEVRQTGSCIRPAYNVLCQVDLVTVRLKSLEPAGLLLATLVFYRFTTAAL